MTREERKQLKEQNKAAEIARRIAIRQEKSDQKSWDKMVTRAKAKGAWIDEPEYNY